MRQRLIARDSDQSVGDGRAVGECGREECVASYPALRLGGQAEQVVDEAPQARPVGGVARVVVKADRAAAHEDNLRALDEAAALGTRALVLVPGDGSGENLLGILSTAGVGSVAYSAGELPTSFLKSRMKCAWSA